MSAKLPAHVNTLAPAGVWNLLSLPAGDLKMGQIKGMHNEGGGDRGCIYTGRVCGGRQGLAKGTGEVETMKRRGKGRTVPKCPTLPRIQGYRPLLFFCSLKTDIFVLVSVSCSISQTKYTQLFEEFAAGHMGRLSMITQRGHFIPCDPNLGPVTQKPKPRADKQGPGPPAAPTEAG